jgi:hypothetical protein
MSFALSPFSHKKAHNRTLLFGNTLLKNGRHFDYWNQPVNMRMRVCYVDYREAGLCCYLVIHIENLLRQLQLFYFHLCPIITYSPSHRVAGWMNDELKRILKEVVVVWATCYPRICLKGLRKTQKASVRIVGIPNEIRTEYLTNTSIERVTAAASYSTRVGGEDIFRQLCYQGRFSGIRCMSGHRGLLSIVMMNRDVTSQQKYVASILIYLILLTSSSEQFGTFRMQTGTREAAACTPMRYAHFRSSLGYVCLRTGC